MKTQLCYRWGPVSRGIAIALLFAGQAGILAAEKLHPLLPADISVQKDIVYKTVDNIPVTLDLFGIKDRQYTNAPLLIFIHGGGYTGGNKGNIAGAFPGVFAPLIRDEGFRVASLDYRLAVPGFVTIIDGQVDCKDAVRFIVKNHQQLGIDTNRIVTMGGSAGGSLALVCALSKDTDLPGAPELKDTPSPVRAGVSWFGMSDFVPVYLSQQSDPAHTALTDEIMKYQAAGHTPRFQDKSPVFPVHATLHDYEIVSPVWYMHRRIEDPRPVITLQGNCDVTVPVYFGFHMQSEADAIHYPHTFVCVTNAGHGFQQVKDGVMVPGRDEIDRITRNFIISNSK